MATALSDLNGSPNGQMTAAPSGIRDRYHRMPEAEAYVPACFFFIRWYTPSTMRAPTTAAIKPAD